MHRINRPREPLPFRKYREKYLEQHPWPMVKPKPADDWNAFGSVLLSDYDTTHHVVSDEKKLKSYALEKLSENQHGLCAYCEEKLPPEGDRRIEHFHPKSDVATEHCWMFDWENLLAVCAGGCSNNVFRETTPCDSDDADPLHCDASKKEKRTPILNPYTMPRQRLFSFDKITGELSADESMCNQVHIDVKLVTDTISILNLNCSTLKGHRRDFAQHYMLEYKKLQREMNDGKLAKGSVRNILAQRWFGDGKNPSLFTTRRWLLQGKAEPYIASN